MPHVYSLAMAVPDLTQCEFHQDVEWQDHVVLQLVLRHPVFQWYFATVWQNRHVLCPNLLLLRHNQNSDLRFVSLIRQLSISQKSRFFATYLILISAHQSLN